MINLNQCCVDAKKLRIVDWFFGFSLTEFFLISCIYVAVLAFIASIFRAWIYWIDKMMCVCVCELWIRRHNDDIILACRPPLCFQFDILHAVRCWILLLPPSWTFTCQAIYGHRILAHVVTFAWHINIGQCVCVCVRPNVHGVRTFIRCAHALRMLPFSFNWHYRFGSCELGERLVTLRSRQATTHASLEPAILENILKA